VAKFEKNLWTFATCTPRTWIFTDTSQWWLNHRIHVYICMGTQLYWINTEDYHKYYYFPSLITHYCKLLCLSTYSTANALNILTRFYQRAWYSIVSILVPTLSSRCLTLTSVATSLSRESSCVCLFLTESSRLPNATCSWSISLFRVSWLCRSEAIY
jgi:hypothetical protein